jgi:hypothetical protein
VLASAASYFEYMPLVCEKCLELGEYWLLIVFAALTEGQITWLSHWLVYCLRKNTGMFGFDSSAL